MRNHFITGLIIATLSWTPVLALVHPEHKADDPRLVRRSLPTLDSRKLDPAEQTPAGQRARGFLDRVGGKWDFSIDPRTGRPVSVRGSGLPMIPGRGNALSASALTGLPMPQGRITIDTLEPLARGFIEDNEAWLKPPRGTLELDRQASTIRRDGGLVSIYFAWRVDGIPVEGAYVFLRLNSGNVTWFGAPFVGPFTTSTQPVLGSRQALETLMAHSGDGELYRLESEPMLVLQPEDGPGRLDYRLVWKIVYRTFEGLETWEGRVDAQTGEIVSFRDTNAYTRVTGGIHPRSVYDANEVTVALPWVSLINDGVGEVTDVAGGFLYSGGPVSTVLDGEWFDTICVSCSNPEQPQLALEFGAGILDLGTGGADEIGNGTSSPADRDTFYHLNQVRRIGKKWLPSLTWLDQPLTSYVNISDTCNAYYDGDVNFFRSGGGCNNTGEIADVITHEWGHGLDNNTLGGDGATGEGTADVVAMHLSHSPLIGPGFQTDGTPVRNLDSSGPRGLLSTTNIADVCPTIGTLGPLGYEVHCEGEIYGQVAWDLAQALVARDGPHTGWRTSERIFFTSLPDAGSYFPYSPSIIYDAYVQADDDDGNLANGTPNAQEIYDAFDAHGIAGTPYVASPACERPAQPVLTVTPACDSFELSWVAVDGVDHYEIFRGELREDQAFFPVSTAPAGQTSYTDTQVAPGMDYWYAVMAVDGAGCESTVDRPVAARLHDQPVLSIDVVATDDTPRGNRSGFPDPGEEVDLILGVRNYGSVAATAVSGTIVSTTPGVQILDAVAAWPQIDVGASAENVDVLRIRTDPAQNLCGDLLQFQFVPDEGSGCATDTSYFSVELGDAGVCDPTPACYVEPTFAGLQSASAGASCAETLLGWQTATTHCQNATISYNVYRGTDPAFAPGPSNQIASGLSSTTFVDALLDPGQLYYYVVRAFDSRSGEDGNVDALGVAAPGLPDLRPPVFTGLASAVTGAGCGEAELAWPAAFETCSAPITYEIYRSADPAFTPGPATRIGSTTTPGFTDLALQPDSDFTYVVRSRDAAGNEDLNDVRITVASGVTDHVVSVSDFETSPDGWATTAPDDAVTGSWEWGDPEATSFQPEDCAAGVNCWITGLTALLAGGGNNDVDDGTTTLLSRAYDLSGLVDPAIRYSRWFTNDLGASPGEDPLVVEVSNDDGTTWFPLETVGAGTPLAWVPVELALPGGVTPTDAVRVRFTASDLGLGGSLVEAGIDELSIVDLGQGCNVCAPTTGPVGTILVSLSGDDVVIDWSDDPAPGASFAVYALEGPEFATATRIGTTGSRNFVHAGAALSGERFAYRVSAVNVCGTESALD
jgi:Zn-dependent metalloprotease